MPKANVDTDEHADSAHGNSNGNFGSADGDQNGETTVGPPAEPTAEASFADKYVLGHTDTYVDTESVAAEHPTPSNRQRRLSSPAVTDPKRPAPLRALYRLMSCKALFFYSPFYSNCDKMLTFQRERKENRLSTQTQTVFERIRKLCCEQLGVEVDQVTLQSRFVDDLNADSLDLVELVMSMEEEFAHGGKTLEITDEEAEKLATVADVIEFLAGKGFKD